MERKKLFVRVGIGVAGALYVRYGAGDLVEMRKVDRVPGYMRYDNERNT